MQASLNGEFSPEQISLVKSALAAGEIQRTYFRSWKESDNDAAEQTFVSTKQNRHSLLTKADIESQEMIKMTLLTCMADIGYTHDEIGFIAEEELYEPSKYTFIIDPLDGTTNFAFGIDHFCVSIALYCDGKPKSGCVYAPISDVAYLAEEGRGTYKIVGVSQLNNTPHTASIKIDAYDASLLHMEALAFHDSLIVLNLTYNPERSAQRIKFIENIQPHVQNVRMFGATALDFCLVANNYFQLGLNSAFSWDFAAADIIIREAGGSTFDWQGNQFTINIEDEHKKRLEIAACHPQNRSRFLDFIQKSQS